MRIETPAFKRGRMGTPNAFAVGRRGAGVVVSEVMLAHELVYVKNRDVVILLLGEYVADAAEYTGDPDALARSLATIQQVGTSEQAADVDASTAAMCIFGGKRGLLDRVFATHPPMEKRIERLQSQ